MRKTHPRAKATSLTLFYLLLQKADNGAKFYTASTFTNILLADCGSRGPYAHVFERAACARPRVPLWSTSLTAPARSITYRKRRIASDEQQVYRMKCLIPLRHCWRAQPPQCDKRTQDLDALQFLELKYTGTLTFR
ncbi:hypothetical protein EV363DRAFT_1392469 [Boletus edulis]|nr:hypothetical protein EV363DRAFT_1392469 [Boletus edulis]